MLCRLLTTLGSEEQPDVQHKRRNELRKRVGTRNEVVHDVYANQVRLSRKANRVAGNGQW